MSTRTSGKRSSAERRRQIASAALKIVAEGGLHQLTTAALAERVGLAEGTIFRHFHDKAEILAVATELIEEMFEHALPDTNDEALSRLGEFVRRRLTLVELYPGIQRIMFSDHLATSGSPEAVEQVARLKQRAIDFMLDALREARAKGQVREDIELDALLLIVHGTAMAAAFSVNQLAGRGIRLQADATWAAIEHLIRRPS
ncbi:TetR/AcrR family transcriptional regulator [Lujinxingia vulgaris]|uniref:TetR/AcrR family transcriptional regulator n=1 Tax=Lujinxingia vulgaris TaxID=2600176 RepID=A0A5C6XBM1_9DELT|nr:TetR/AcrR family transcriptional regulator [Lujinxingia vulgaris]TXD37117.1 TetR/AcrR family transcriptional regulator [Lujinxingia vulgaris]